MKRITALLGATCVAAAWAGVAFAFGTVSILGQDREHERITRHALACGAHGAAAAPHCFQPHSLDLLAGKAGTFGGVGAPDDPTYGLLTSDAAHCDNGDYLALPGGYAQTQPQAQQNLQNCRAWMNQHLNLAVQYAANLLTAAGAVNPAQIQMGHCSFNGKAAHALAKCAVLEELGVSLHASQDFYSHSNWVDDAGPGPSSITNPPGLQNGPSAAAWLNLRVAAPVFPVGLITGCFVEKSLVPPPETYGCSGRVKHYYLNKDKGPIDPVLGVGKTPRGAVGHNFDYAVTAAIADTQDKWAILNERLAAQYGVANANRMICTIANDNPVAN